MERSQINLEIGTKSAPKTSPKIWTQTEKQFKLRKSREMDHDLGYRGQIWVIQKPNIKFIDASTTSMKDMSPKSLIFLIKNLSQGPASVQDQNRAAFSHSKIWPNSPLGKKHHHTGLRVENKLKYEGSLPLGE